MFVYQKFPYATRQNKKDIQIDKLFASKSLDHHVYDFISSIYIIE